MDGLLGLLGFAAGLALIAFAIVIAIYVIQAIFLNKFHKLVYGKGTVAAWFPISNYYVLGKLTFNKTVGWCLVFVSLLSSEFTLTVNGVEKVYTLMPGFLSSIFDIGILALYIYAIVKYNDVKKKNNSVLYQQSGNIQQPVQPVVENQPVQPVVENQPVQPVVESQSVQPVVESQSVQPVVENQPVVNESFNQNIDNSVSSTNSNNI